MKNTEEVNKMNLYFEEILRQISSHSAIIAGFAFAGLTMDSGSVTNFAKTGFTICISIAMGFEILALFVSGFLLSALKLNNATDIKWKNHFHLSWWLYLLGLISFLSSLPFIVYLKDQKLFIGSIIFTVFVIYLMSKQLIIIIEKSEVKTKRIKTDGNVVKS